jgi:hypothetical protein
VPAALASASLTFALPIVVDIEASGFGRDSYPIEVGYVLPEGDTYCSLIQPDAAWTHWDDEAQRLHGITRAATVAFGRPPREVARQLNRVLAGQTAYTDGWANDYSWMGALFDAANLTPAFKLDNLRALLTDAEAEAERWHTVKDQVCAELGLTRHRASTDARLLQLTLRRLRSAAAV